MILETKYSLLDCKERTINPLIKERWYIDTIIFDERGITYGGYIERSNFVTIKKAKGTSVPISILEANNQKFELEEVKKWVIELGISRWALPEKEFEVLKKDYVQTP